MTNLFGSSDLMLLVFIDEARENLKRSDLEGGDRTDFQDIINEAEDIILKRRGFSPRTIDF